MAGMKDKNTERQYIKRSMRVIVSLIQHVICVPTLYEVLISLGYQADGIISLYSCYTR